jgi:hypothetical protein
MFGKVLQVLDPQLYTHLSKFNEDLPYPFMSFLRWFLVLFRQEVSFQSSLQLWDSMFTHPLRAQYDLFIASSMVLAKKSTFMAASDQAELMSLANRLGDQVDVKQALKGAQQHYATFVNKMKPCVKTPKKKACTGLDVPSLTKLLS